MKGTFLISAIDASDEDVNTMVELLRDVFGTNPDYNQVKFLVSRKRITAHEIDTKTFDALNKVVPDSI